LTSRCQPADVASPPVSTPRAANSGWHGARCRRSRRRSRPRPASRWSWRPRAVHKW